MLIVPDWHGAGTGINYGVTPGGVYFKLKDMAPYDPNVKFGTSTSPAGSGSCN